MAKPKKSKVHAVVQRTPSRTSEAAADRTSAANGAVAMRAKHSRPLDHIAEAHYVRPSQIFLRFADGLEGTWTFSQLDLDMSNMKLTTVKASDSGNSVAVKSKRGEDVQLDSSSLRVLVDPEYARQMEKKLDMLASQIGL
jgi:hypothetical protein